MSASFDLERPDHFTAGAVGAPGERVFYLQAREAEQIVTLKCEKEQVRALGDYLAGLLQKMPERSAVGADAELLDPVEPAWDVASLGVGYDKANDRIVVVANQAVEEDEEAAEGAGGAERPEPATARFAISRAQAAGFVERSRALMEAGRPICSLCSLPMDPGGHICPRRNGHAAGHR